MNPSPSTSAARVSQPKTRKADKTRQKILDAACELFGSRGFNGTSISDIEEASGVNRGLVSYHFGTKGDLWKAVVDAYFTEYIDDLETQREILEAVDLESQFRVVVRSFVLFSARRPTLSKIMIQENLDPSWRQDWIIEQFLVPIRKMGQTHTNFEVNKDTLPALARHYALVGACTLPFMVAPEIQKMHGVNVFGDEFVNELVRVVTDLYVESGE